MRWGKILAAVAVGLLIAGTSSGWAQERPVSLYETSPLDFQMGYDSGAPYGTQKISSPVGILTLPTFSLQHTSPRNDFELFYQPQFEMFTEAPGLDSWNHFAGLRWQADISPRWSFTASDTFFANHDDGELFETTFMLPRGPYRENGLYTSLNFDLTPRTRIKFRYENAFADFRSQNLPQPLFFSRMGNTFGVTVDHHLTARSLLSVSYSYLLSQSFDQYDYLGNVILPTPATHILNATYTYNLTDSLLVELNGGYIRNPQNSYILGAIVEKHFQKFTVAGGFNRYLTFLGTETATSIGTPLEIVATRALAPNSITNTASFRASGPLGQHWLVDAEVLASETTGDIQSRLRSAMGGLKVTRKLSDHVAAFVSFDLYRQNMNAILPIPISRGRYFGGIEYTFSPTPDEINRRKEANRNRDTNSGTQVPPPVVKEN